MAAFEELLEAARPLGASRVGRLEGGKVFGAVCGAETCHFGGGGAGVCYVGGMMYSQESEVGFVRASNLVSVCCQDL